MSGYNGISHYSPRVSGVPWEGSYIKAMDKVKAKITTNQRAKIFARLRAKNTAIRERGKQRALRMSRQGWKSSVNLAQFGFGTTGRTAY